MLASSAYSTRTLCAHVTRHVQRAAIVARPYYTSANSTSTGYGYTAYSDATSYSAAVASPASAVGCPSAVPEVSPMECMNRNARKPGPANHGARPNSSYNRKSSSPEFGSWRHPGLRPGQTPPPRPQPGTPMTIATVGIGAPSATTSQQTNKKQTA